MTTASHQSRHRNVMVRFRSWFCYVWTYQRGHATVAATAVVGALVIAWQMGGRP